MRYFEVKKEIIEGNILTAEVERDGEMVGLPEASDTQDIKTIVLGFSVFDYGEDGMMTENVEFYPVITNMETFENNEEEVLDKIENEHPAPEWQNNRW